MIWTNILQSIGASVGSAGIIYVAISLRRYLKTHSDQHEFLMDTTKQNTTEIKRMLDLQEKRDRRRSAIRDT